MPDSDMMADVQDAPETLPGMTMQTRRKKKVLMILLMILVRSQQRKMQTRRIMLLTWVRARRFRQRFTVSWATWLRSWVFPAIRPLPC